jgi:imidazolonepropionase-like amidohydrolase
MAGHFLAMPGPLVAAAGPFLAAAGLVLVTAASRAAVPVPGEVPRRPVALVGATIHTVSGGVVSGGTLIFSQGKITAVGANVSVPENAERIDLSGKHVYPGLVNARSSLGLTEIDALRATKDVAEVGPITPNVRAEVAINPESELLPVARANGVLAAVSAPSGGRISGSSALIVLDGWTWQEMTVRAPVAMHVNWPKMSVDRAPVVPDSVETKQRKERDGALRELRDAFDAARAYLRAKSAAAGGAQAPPNDQRWEAMIPVLEGKIPLAVEADELLQIESAVEFAAREKVRLVIVGGYDSPRCAPLLKQYDVPVIVSDVHRLPRRPSEPYDDPFTLPSRLRHAGVRFCLALAPNAWDARNLPYQASTAAAYGLPPDEALKAVTLYPAQILGFADRLGSLEVGKDATLIVTDGDPLEITTNVERAYIAGRPVDLNDRQKVLYGKYSEKYRRLELIR